MKALRSTCLPLLSVAAVSLFATTASHAALLVYDGYNYAANSALLGTNPGADTVGLDKTTAYSSGNAGTFTVQGSGLTFAGLATSGGSVGFNSAAASVAVAKIALASSFTGTLWSSYLINFSGTRGTSAADGVMMRVADTNSNSNDRFQSIADSRLSSLNVGSSYGLAANASNGTTALVTGTTYIMVSRFTNVGATLSVGTPGVATVWALTEAQFASFNAAGSTEAYLNSATVGVGSTSISATSTSSATSGTYNFATGNFAHFVSVGNNGTFDELRYGSTLADVTPVPEPATVALLMGVAVAAGAVVRRRKIAQGN